MIETYSKRYLSIVIVLIVFLLIFFLVYYFQLPLFIPLLVFLILAEYVYLKERIIPYRNLDRNKYLFLISFFLFPWVLLVTFVVISIFLHPALWLPDIRIYSIASIMISFGLHIFPVSFFLLERLLGRFRKKKKQKTEKVITRRNFVKNLAWSLSGMTFALLSSGVFIWNHKFKVHKHIISFKRLPIAFKSFRILQISDMHLGTWDSIEAFKELVELVNRQEADIVVFTGDLLDYMTNEAYRFEEYLRQIKAKDGVFAILGNHDYGDYYQWKSEEEKKKNFQALLDFYEKIGWKLLRNESIILEKDGEKVLLSGLENWGNMKRYQKLADISKALKTYEHIPFKIILSHNPVHWEKKLRDFPQTIDLCLSGHTHGGQVGVELNGFRWSPIQYLYRYWAGAYQEVNKTTGEIQTLYVNRGTGSIAYPGRLGILPEVTVIELA